MISFLREIWHGIASIPFWIMDGIMAVINAVIAGFAALLGVLYGALPDMPAPAGPLPGGVGTWLSWLLPIGPLLAGFAVFLALWGAFFLVRWGLRFIRFL